MSIHYLGSASFWWCVLAVYAMLSIGAYIVTMRFIKEFEPRLDNGQRVFGVMAAIFVPPFILVPLFGIAVELAR